MAKYLSYSGLSRVVDYIKTLLNGKVDTVDGKGLSTNDYTTAEKNKLLGIATGAEVNVQSDWNVTSTTSDAYIKNKPTLGTAATYTATTSVGNNSYLPTGSAIQAYVTGLGYTKNTGTVGTTDDTTFVPLA